MDAAEPHKRKVIEVNVYASSPINLRSKLDFISPPLQIHVDHFYKKKIVQTRLRVLWRKS